MSLSRRKFIEVSSLSSSLLILGCLPSESSEVKVAKAGPELAGIDLNQFIAISTDGNITLFNHRPEMGQGTFQSIPMILAEELEVDISQVTIKQSPADSKLYGRQMVVGSRSIQTEFDKLRQMGASAREMLRQAAADQWEVSLKDCIAENGQIKGPRGNLSYGELVERASKLPVPKSPPLKAPSDFKVIGQPIARQDIPLKTNGAAQYGIDIQVPGMLYASIQHCPQFTGSIKSINKEEVLALAGITHVLTTSRHIYGRDIPGVAVVGKDYWSVIQGRRALKVEWALNGEQKVNVASMMKDSLAADQQPGDELFGNGDVKNAFDQASEVITAAYETPYQAHVPMEPMNATVHIQKNQATFWGSTQNPNGMRSFISNKYDIQEANITINYTFMGGGFGRRSNPDVLEEAADLSYQTQAPVKLLWSREDDQTQGPFRACSYNVCRAVLNDSGTIQAFEHKVIAQEIRNQSGSNLKAGRQLMGGINIDYQIPNYSVKGVLQRRHIPIAYWRAVYHSTNPFAHESFVDELAHKAGKDPLEFRLAMLEHPRYIRVLKAVAEAVNWETKTSGIGRGIATVERSGAYFAMVVAVKREGKAIIPVKITTAIDLGICVNPDTVKAQTEGSIVMGLTAVYAGLTVNEGAIVEQNFNTYPLLKLSQCPEIETIILKSDAPPDGAGEAGLPTVAPALANAIFDLTGKRVRKLPMDLSELG